MNRREAINRVTIMLGGTIIGAEFFLSACNQQGNKVQTLFKEDDIAFLNEVAETILPETSTPGAKAANVGEFMTVMVNDCYTPKEQQIFIKGITALDTLSEQTYGKRFLKINAKEKNALLTRLDKAQKDFTNHKKPEDTAHYFRMMKELCLLGYFTSEIGCTKALRYVAIPGKYIGCIPYKKGDKAWAT
jgi:hypothetical protein